MIPLSRFHKDFWSRSAWSEFEANGLVVRRELLSAAETEGLRQDCAAFEQIAIQATGFADGGYRRALAISERFMRLVCDPRLLGLAYDLYGEQTSLHSFDLFIRPPGGEKRHSWHFDGPRRLPYASFSPSLPLVLKFGIWLTDVPASDWGAYQYIPGSHRNPPLAAYCQEIDLHDQKPLIVKAGDVSIHHSDLWHRVSPNTCHQTRYCLFVTYSPSWITPRETFAEVQVPEDLPQLKTLLRAYTDLTYRIKPPNNEPPLHPNADISLLQGERIGAPPIFGEIIS